jgi:hypothetical protein
MKSSYDVSLYLPRTVCCCLHRAVTYDVLLHLRELVGEVVDLGDVAVVLRRVVTVGHQGEAEVAAAVVAAQLGDLLGDLEDVVLRTV